MAYVSYLLRSGTLLTYVDLVVSVGAKDTSDNTPKGIDTHQNKDKDKDNVCVGGSCSVDRNAGNLCTTSASCSHLTICLGFLSQTRSHIDIIENPSDFSELQVI